MKTRCLIIDDEPPALEVLRNYIMSTPTLELVGECHHAMEAFDFLQHHEVDLLFIDIQMPKLLGHDFIKVLPNPPKFIFTTAHREYALDGFELSAVDYLLKPISFDRFLKSVHKALHIEQKHTATKTESHQIENDRFLYFRADRKMVKVMVNEIRYVESLKDYVKIFNSKQPLITKQTISALEEMLPEDDFVRIHRSFIVALNKINSYTPHAVFIDKEEIPIGPLFREEVAKRLTMSQSA